MVNSKLSNDGSETYVYMFRIYVSYVCFSRQEEGFKCGPAQTTLTVGVVVFSLCVCVAVASVCACVRCVWAGVGRSAVKGRLLVGEVSF